MSWFNIRSPIALLQKKHLKQIEKKESHLKKTGRFSLSTFFNQIKNGHAIQDNTWHSRHPRLSRTFYYLFLPITHPVLRIVTLLLASLFALALILLMRQLPNPKMMVVNERYDVSTQIFDRNGQLLYEIYGDVNRIPIKLSELPEHVKQATIAIEDKRFYQHFGVDLEGVVRAVIKNLKHDRQEGGSTITQQLVKNALLSPEKSLTRKAKEAVLAVLTELVYSKDEILEMYLNYIPYGGTSVGIEAASQAYFNKSAKDLSLAEASLLAGLPQAPTRYSPFGSSPERAKARQADVLRRMVEDGYISALQAEEAKSQTLTYALSQTEIKAPHFVFFVRDYLYEKYGEEKVERGGLRVYTTLDLNLQQEAQQMLAEEVEKIEKYKVSNAAAMITKPNTGEILAMIGSKDYFNSQDDGQVNVTIALRQPGSSIKPITYATAFQNKALHPGTLLVDEPTCFQEGSLKPYCPKNYDGSFRGAVTVRQSLGNSLNIPAVKAQALIGTQEFINQATRMGITTWKDPALYGLSLTLGGGEVKMIDMAQAFGVLGTQGVLVPLTPILKIEDYLGKEIEVVDIEQRLEDLDYISEFETYGQIGELERVIDRAPAYLVSHILQDNQARSMVFGTRSKLVIPDHIVSAKTGTTNEMKDNWTVGYTPQFLVITWVGNNDGEPMGRMVSGIMGAAPIFNRIMTRVLENQETIWQEKPPDVASGGVCASGMPPQAGEETCEVRTKDLYWTRSVPANSKYAKENVWIDPNTGQPPPFGVDVQGLVLQERIMLKDPVTSYYCQDCETKLDAEGKPVQSRKMVQTSNGKILPTNP
ncbi:MAG TPA: PBP1A family penicillin-binding protein [Candidatus Woesebacteria bacterium]|mgnify:CR=1 FL=1|nr:PBP1A family penicillin-binding protein [Candidatus Woesebacteria bacterium]